MTVAHEGRPGWGWQTGEWVRTPCFLRSRGHAPSPPSCSSAACGGPAGAAVRKKGLSEYSRTAPTRGWQGKLQADAYMRTWGTQVSRTNIAHLFLLIAETSKLMN